MIAPSTEVVTGILRGNSKPIVPGTRFGKLVVQSCRPPNKNERGGIVAVCLCDCGMSRDVAAVYLRRTNRATQDCGGEHPCTRCGEELKTQAMSLHLGMHAAAEALVGKLFGRLTVESVLMRKGRPTVVCRCTCGELRTVVVDKLRRKYFPIHSCRRHPCEHCGVRVSMACAERHRQACIQKILGRAA